VNTDRQDAVEELNPWCGKYCMSFFTKTRTAKTIGKDHLSIALKMQYFDWDEKRDASGDYHSLPSGDKKRKLTNVFCAKYGWAKDHHIGLGVPMFFNDFDLGGTTNKSEGVGNIFIFEKWNFLKETNTRPAMAVDFWYYLPTGDPDRKLGSDNGAYKITGEVSKAWKAFSLHLNPAYTFNETKKSDIDEINAGVIFTPTKNFWPAVEYNYYHAESKGHAHDIVPGFIWKFAKGAASFKLGVVVNMDSTYTYRDEVGFVTKLFYRF
ncbi:MAG: transporter, partial [Planctomycetota bacterium]